MQEGDHFPFSPGKTAGDVHHYGKQQQRTCQQGKKGSILRYEIDHQRQYQ